MLNYSKLNLRVRVFTWESFGGVIRNYSNISSPKFKGSSNEYYLNIHDLSTKLPINHPYNKANLDSIKFIIGSNNLISNQKQIYPLINISRSITGQAPVIVKAKRSVASFKLRKNNPIAISTTLRKNKANNFLNLLMLYFIPRIHTSLSNISTNKSLSFGKSLQMSRTPYKISLYFGFNNITLFSYITPLASDYKSLISNLSLPAQQSRTTSPKGEGLDNTQSEGSNLEYLELNKVGGYVQINSKFLLNLPKNELYPIFNNYNKSLLDLYIISLILKYPFHEAN